MALLCECRLIPHFLLLANSQACIVLFSNFFFVCLEIFTQIYFRSDLTELEKLSSCETEMETFILHPIWLKQIREYCINYLFNQHNNAIYSVTASFTLFCYFLCVDCAAAAAGPTWTASEKNARALIKYRFHCLSWLYTIQIDSTEVSLKQTTFLWKSEYNWKIRAIRFRCTSPIR